MEIFHSDVDAPLPSARFYCRRAKRWLDVAFAALLMLFIWPILVGSMLLVKRDGGPALFAHWRIGRGGRPFVLWKIRTMQVHAEGWLTKYLDSCPNAAAEWAEHRKLAKDPRVTAIGRFLRRWKIDELPQLWNVALGEMSLVGPRPVTKSELDDFPDHRQVFEHCRPGITGPWQINGISTYSRRISQDKEYAMHVSLALDLNVMLKTPAAILRSGAVRLVQKAQEE